MMMGTVRGGTENHYDKIGDIDSDARGDQTLLIKRVSIKMISSINLMMIIIMTLMMMMMTMVTIMTIM